MYCWSNADLYPGRDGKRWRMDVAGNPVLKLTRGDKYKEQPYAWEYDKAPDGKCRIVQYHVGHA